MDVFKIKKDVKRSKVTNIMIIKYNGNILLVSLYFIFCFSLFSEIGASSSSFSISSAAASDNDLKPSILRHVNIITKNSFFSSK